MDKKQEPGMAYNMSKLNKVFALLSFLFLMTVFWVFMDDYIRPWKAIQVKAMQIKRQKLEEKILLADESIDKNKLKEIEEQIATGEEELKEKKDEIAKVNDKIESITDQLRAQKIDDGDFNAQVTALTFQYESAFAHYGEKGKETQKIFEKLRKFKALFASSKDEIKRLEKEEKESRAELASLNAKVTDAKKEIENIQSSKMLLGVAKSKTDFNPVFFLRNAPFLDFLDPTIKIQQIVLDHITDDRYFRSVYKVDRCITCHTFINEKGYEDQENPYKTHPHLDLMLGANSPHPLKQIGCTSCHGGEGHRVVDFSAAAHMPESDEQRAEWVEKYHYSPAHKIPEPMLKKKYTWGACVKCHQDVERIPGGAVVETNQGIRNIEKFGCYACHKIEGWEHKRNPGPSLEKIAAKVSKDFFKSWVWSPKSFNKHTKMPSFFMQDNNSKKEFRAKNITEVNAMAEYIWEKSKPYQAFANYNGGNKEEGKKLIGEVGCLGCHGVEGFEKESQKIDAYAGPYLSGIGSKVNPNWLVSWLLKPSHYQENTIMPSFRLSEKEAGDIASYLLSLKNKTFDSLGFEAIDNTLRDEILVNYLSAFATKKDAEAKLAEMSDREKTLDLGFRSVGKYGCYSCHTIDGFSGRVGIGPELTKIGLKPVSQLGFGHEPVQHDLDSWLKAHLLNPRRWDRDTDKAFGDINRMPNYYMSEKDAEKVTGYLLGLVGDKIPKSGRKQLDAHEKIYQEGWKVLNKNNCIGCHKIDGEGGDILLALEDEQMGPPYLVGEGHRVRSEWLFGFLDNVYPIRPWLQVRMPSYHFAHGEKNTIVAGFREGEKQPTFEPLEKVQWAPGEREAAKGLWESYACASCHTNGFSKDEPTAPNLLYAKSKLRKSWIKKWLRNPQAIVPTTPMPNFFEDGKATDETILDGDAEKQIEALTKYVLELGYDNYYWEKKN